CYSYCRAIHNILFLLFCTAQASPAIYPLSLHDALPIFFAVTERYVNATVGDVPSGILVSAGNETDPWILGRDAVFGRETYLASRDRKSTRLNSSHVKISYAVFCLKKKTMTYGGVSDAAI